VLATRLGILRYLKPRRYSALIDIAKALRVMRMPNDGAPNDINYIVLYVFYAPFACARMERFD